MDTENSDALNSKDSPEKRLIRVMRHIKQAAPSSRCVPEIGIARLSRCGPVA
jgi:hypothetical protein